MVGEKGEAEFAVLGGVLKDFFPGSANWSSGKGAVLPVFLLSAGALTRAYPEPAGWEWAALAGGMWERVPGGIWELDEQRVMGRAASSVSLLGSMGITAVSSSQAAGGAAQGRDGRAGAPGGSSLPRSWPHPGALGAFSPPEDVVSCMAGLLK